MSEDSFLNSSAIRYASCLTGRIIFFIFLRQFINFFCHSIYLLVLEWLEKLIKIRHEAPKNLSRIAKGRITYTKTMLHIPHLKHQA